MRDNEARACGARRNIKWRGVSGLLVAALGGGCAGDDVGPGALTERVRALDTDLSLGSTGEQVRTLNEYLSTRGYYPNAQIAAEYPAWRPAVSTAPDDPSVFD